MDDSIKPPGYIPHLDKRVGDDNPTLLHIARQLCVTSPPINEVIAINDEVKATSEKEVVGLGFNRYVSDALKVRWDKLEKAQTNLKLAMIHMKGPMEEVDAKCKHLIKDSARDRMTVMVLGARIRQFEGLLFNLEAYLSHLKQLIEYYLPYKHFMRLCADRMQFQNEMGILFRFETLDFAKQEMMEFQQSNFQEMEKQKHLLSLVKDESDKIHLRLSNKISDMIQQHFNMVKANTKFETALNQSMSESSETTRSLFRIVSGVRKIYDSLDKYKRIEDPTEDPFEMMNVINWRFLNIQSAMEEIYRLTEMESLKGVIVESRPPEDNNREIRPEEKLLNLKEAENKAQMQYTNRKKSKASAANAFKKKLKTRVGGVGLKKSTTNTKTPVESAKTKWMNVAKRASLAKQGAPDNNANAAVNRRKTKSPPIRNRSWCGGKSKLPSIKRNA